MALYLTRFIISSSCDAYQPTESQLINLYSLLWDSTKSAAFGWMQFVEATISIKTVSGKVSTLSEPCLVQ